MFVVSPGFDGTAGDCRCCPYRVEAVGVGAPLVRQATSSKSLDVLLVFTTKNQI